jgi:exonuclease V gamma subunit
LLLPAPTPRFASLAREETPEPRDWSLSALVRCLASPGRYWCRVAQVRPESPERERWEESGELDGLQRYRGLERALELIASGCAAPEPLAGQLLREGRLPAGALGRDLAAELATQALALAAMQREHVEGRTPAARAPFELVHSGRRVTGTVRDCYGGRLVRVIPGNLHARNSFGGWVEGLAFAAAGVALEEIVLIGLSEKSATCRRIALDPDIAVEFERLLAIADLAAREPLPLFPKSGLAYVESLAKDGDPAEALFRARVCWGGAYQQRGESEDAGLALYTRDWADPLASPFPELAEALHRPWFQRTRAGS